MNYSTYRFTLDIHKTKSQVSIPVKYMDTGIQFLISFTDGGKPYLIAPGCTAVFYGKKADDTTLVEDCEISEENTRVIYTFSDQTTTREGIVESEIRLYSKDGLLITTPSFEIVVDPRVVKDEDIVLSEDERSAIDRMFENESQREAAENARVTAEIGRQEAEAARVIAEGNREQTVNEARGTALNALSIAKGAIQALSFMDYAELVSTLNQASMTAYNVGQNLYIRTHGVPDLWIYAVSPFPISYVYTDDDTFISDLTSASVLTVGCYRLAMLETQKVDMNEYFKVRDAQTHIENALATAKASGEFDGKDGVSVTHSWNGTTLTVTSASGSSSVNLKGEQGEKGEQGIQGIQGEKGEKGEQGIQGIQGEKGKDGANGTNGANGVSATHSWNGTTLTITSASGSSSANLKGEKGDKGDKGDTGATGATGANGYTPIMGTDYWTEAEQAEWSKYIASELAKRGQLKPEFVNDVSECKDSTKLYVLPDGFIYAYMYTEGEKPLYTDVLASADTTTLISGDLTTATVKQGYFEGVRLNSSGLTKSQSGYCATGFIPYTYKGASDKIRIKPATLVAGSYAHELCFYDSTRKFLGYAAMSINSGTIEQAMNSDSNGTVGWTISKDSDGVFTLTWQPSATNAFKNATLTPSNIAYIRIGMSDFAGSVITINEEIVGGASEAGYKWANTGRAFVPADYEDRIIALEKKSGGGSSTQTYLNARNTYIAPVPSGYCESKLTFTDFGTRVTDALKSDTALRAMINNFRAIASANPNYITETLLGKDASGTYDIYKYELDLKPAMEDGYSSVMKKDKPVFIITAGLHGLEPDAVFEVYHFMQDICNNFMESEHLEYLRTNVKFVIVPLSNPWGFVNGNYNNSNNVNLNKNFEHGFSKVTNATNTQLNTGENPYSEAEAVLLKGVFDEYKNAVFHLECHGKAGADANYNDVIWFSLMASLASDLIELSANNVIHQIGRKLYKMGYNEGKTEGGYITYYDLNGRPKDYTGTEYGMLSCTMEGTGRMSVAGHTTFTKDEQRINCEALENFILNVLALLNSRVEI